MTLPPPPAPHPGFGSLAQLWLLRHGEVHADWQGRAYGGMDVPLSEAGERATRDAVEVFSKLPLSAVYSSPLERARILGEGLAQAARAPLRIVPALAEIRRGTWQGRAFAEIESTHPGELAAYRADPWRRAPHGGETDAELLARVWPVVEGAVREHGSAALAFTCHANVIRVILAHALGVPPAESFRLSPGPSAACLLRDSPAGWTLECSNVLRPPGCALAE